MVLDEVLDVVLDEAMVVEVEEVGMVGNMVQEMDKDSCYTHTRMMDRDKYHIRICMIGTDMCYSHMMA